ncbi:MAG: rplQ [Patescibacteria group bacterium]|nr:rplQ [Patescibacteria group bacterium]
MRHHDNNRKFGRERKVRIAFLRGLIRALVINGRIQTTLPRAKEIRPMVEKMVTVAKKGNADLSAIRNLAADMGGQIDVARELVKNIAPKYADRKGGYIRILKLPNRLSDGSEMALIEFV